jgi:hypothetical protein
VPAIVVSENNKLKCTTGCLLYHLADGYNRESGQEKSTVQSRDIKAKKTPGQKKSRTIKSKVIPENNVFYICQYTPTR